MIWCLICRLSIYFWYITEHSEIIIKIPLSPQPKLEHEEFRLFCFHGRELAHKPIRKQKPKSAELTSLGCKGPPGEGQGMSERSDEIPTSPDRREQIP